MPAPEKRTPMLPWIIQIILLACIIVIAVQLDRTQRAKPQQPQPTRGGSSPSLASRYAYAGLPVPRGLQGSILALTNTGYLVGYSDAKHDPLWVCYRLYRTATFKAPPPLPASHPIPGLIHESPSQLTPAAAMIVVIWRPITPSRSATV